MQQVIIDCDPGIDDTLALMLAIQSPELEVVGITTVSGNVPADMGVQNVIKCLSFCNRLDIPIYQGSLKPLKRDYVSAQDTHGADGLGESGIEIHSSKQAEPLDAVSFLVQTFASPVPISVIALGPLTNIALALQQAPHLGQNMTRLVTMGGSYLAHGNCSPVAEYNDWCDPDAAAYVFEHLDRRIEMVGLDVTRKIVLTPNVLAYAQYLNPKVGDFIARITRFYFDFHWRQERVLGCVINDPLAVAYFMDSKLCSGINAYVQVATDGLGIGQTIVDVHNFYHHAANTLVLTQVDTPSFFRTFLATLLQVRPLQIENDLQQLGIG